MVPRLTTLFAGGLLTATLYACGGESTPNPIQAAFAQQVPMGPTGITVAFRFPRQADAPIQLYTLPTMEPVAIEFEVPDVATAEYVGFVREEDLIYTRNAAGELRALDLTAGRFRVIDTLVHRALIGPSGTPFSIRTDSSIGVIRNRQARPWPGRLPALPSQIWGAVGTGIVALFEGEAGPSIAWVTDDWAGETSRIPGDTLATSWWGDFVVVATDTGLVSINPQDSTDRQFLRLANRVTALDISPSGHRVYAASATGLLFIVNRFDFSLLQTASLPGVIRDIRTDPAGKYLLYRPTEPDLVWIASVATPAEVTPVQSEWTDRLPRVAPDGTVLVRFERQVRAIDPSNGSITGSVADPASDMWALISWDPRRPTLQVAAQRATSAASSEPGVQYFAQVSSTSNLNWAQDEVNRLNQAGLPAALIPQSEFDDRYRVGLGPFRTREEAEETGRILGRAFFVVSVEPRANR